MWASTRPIDQYRKRYLEEKPTVKGGRGGTNPETDDRVFRRARPVNVYVLTTKRIYITRDRTNQLCLPVYAVITEIARYRDSLVFYRRNSEYAANVEKQNLFAFTPTLISFGRYYWWTGRATNTCCAFSPPPHSARVFTGISNRTVVFFARNRVRRSFWRRRCRFVRCKQFFSRTNRRNSEQN